MMEQEFDVIEVQDDENETVISQPASRLVVTVAEPEKRDNEAGESEVSMLSLEDTTIRSSRLSVSAPVPKKRSSLARAKHLHERRKSRHESMLTVDNRKHSTVIATAVLSSSDIPLVEGRITSDASQVHAVKSNRGTHRERRHKHSRRKAMLHEPDEIKDMLKTLTPLYRRRLMMELIKSRWYLFALPLAILIVLGVVASFFVLPMLAEEKLIEVFQPPGEIEASWTIESANDIDLNEIAETLETNKTNQYIQNVLKPEMLRIYRSLGKPIEDINITSVHSDESLNKRRKRSAEKNRNFIIEHVIVPSKNKTAYQSDEVDFDLSDMVKGVRRELIESKVIVADPGNVSLRQGSQAVRSVSVESFLQLTLPPMNDGIQYAGIPHYLPIHGGTKLKGCERKPHLKESLEALDISCNSSNSFEHGTTCTITCIHPLLVDPITAKCINGTWSRNNFCFRPCPFVKQDHTFSVWPYKCTGNGDNLLPIQYQDSCTIICKDGYLPTADITTKTCMEDGHWDVDLADCKKSCPLITPPSNGFVQPKKCSDWIFLQLVAGDVCTFSCDDSFVLEGEISTTCDNEGRWTEEVPVCRRKCQLLEPVANAIVHPTACKQPTVFDGMACSYICQPGLRLVGPNIRTCGHDGYWSEFPPQCRHVCSPLDVPPRAYVYPTACSDSFTASPNTCTFSCDTGYLASTDTVVLTCLGDGRWDYQLPSCKAQCQPVSTPQNGSILCTGEIEDSTCKIYCDAGYKLVGATYMICSSNGIWSEPVGYCTKSCPALRETANADFYPVDCSMTLKMEGDVCEYKCMPSYGYVGPRHVTCLKNGSWSANTTCEYQKQFMITMDHNDIHVCISSVQGMPVKTDYANCERKHANSWSIVRGRLIKNAENGLCIGFQETEPLSNLMFLECNDSDALQLWTWPLQSGQNYTMKLLDLGLQLSYGYKASQNIISAYSPSRLTVWQLFDIEAGMATSFYGILNHGKCFSLSPVENGRWLPESCQTNAVKSGAKCSFLCTPGYETQDESSAVCSNGVYTGNTMPKCMKSCSAFSPYSVRNGSVSPELCTTNSNVRSGLICSFHCDPGFSLYGESNVACLMNGQWSTNQPYCKQQCLPVVLSTNLIITPSTSCQNPLGMSEIGTQCYLSCANGYTVEGPRVIECGEDGNWNDTSYNCVRACSKPKSPDHGHVICNEDGYPEGSICTFICTGAMSLYPIGANSILCQANGLWNASTPVCQKFCPALPSGTVFPTQCYTSHSLPNFQKCNFECGVNKKLVGAQETVCLSSGQWNNGIPECVDEKQFLLTVKASEVNHCISVAFHKYQSSYLVEKRTIDGCHFNNSMNRWSIESSGLIRHVATGWCLGVDEIKSNEVFRLTECNSYDNRQRLECEFSNAQNLLKLRNSLYYLNSHEEHSSIVIQKLGKTNSVTWTAINSVGDAGSVCGMLPYPGQCPELVLTAGTNISPYLCYNSVNVGVNCSIVCDFGYQLQSGETAITVACLNMGVWSHSDVTCRRNTCPKLTLPVNGLVSNDDCINNNTYAWSDTACEITCVPGVYRKLVKGATGILYCLGDNVWSEPVPECLEYCSVLTAPDHGLIYPDNCTMEQGRMHGDTCQFKCNTHYSLNGHSEAICNFGVWDISTPTCIQITGPNVCSPMPSPDYGQIVPLECSFSSVMFNTSCTTSCDTGFIPFPSNQGASFCQSNGEWNQPLAECRKLCPNLNSPMYSTIEPPRCTHGHNTKGDECTVVCDPGYGLGYARTLTCISNGQWDEPIMQCTKTPQYLIEFKGNSSCLSAVATDSDWVTKSDCGIVGDRKSTWEWLENTKIRNIATQKCIAPENINRFSPIVLKECSSVSYQWRCSFDTDFQQKLSFNNIILMFMPNKIPRAFSIDQQSIDTFSIPNTWNINARNQTKEGSVCLFRNHGFCGKLPPMENGYLESGCHLQSNIRIGTKCKYHCNPGYEMIGGFQTICTEYGTWSNTDVGSCQRLCPTLSSPANSNLSPSSCDIIQQQIKGTTCSYSCVESYQLSGSPSRVCRGDGKWSGVEPICIKPCPPIMAVGIVNVSPQDCSESSHNPGYVCSINCPTGYHLIGSITRTCLIDGIWTGNDGICFRSCAALSPLSNGRILPLNCLGTSKVSSDACVYTCNSMYSITAEKIRVCTDGMWSGKQPECKRICKTPNPPANGRITCQKYPGVVGSKCNYTCSPDYVLEGDTNERTCLENGLWSHSQPTCARSFQFLLVQSSPPNEMRCLTGTSSRNVRMKEYRYCDINNSKDRWEWYHKKMLRNGYYRTCIAGKVLPVESHLILNTCDDLDLNQRWDCDDPNRPWFIRLTTPKLYPLYSALSTDKILLYAGENLNFLQDFEQYSISVHTQWYAKTLEFNRTGVCTAVIEIECSPLRIEPGLIVNPSSCALQTVLVGTECIFSCGANQLVDPYIRSSTCLKHGLWSEDVPQCVPACPSISKHVNKHIKSSPIECLLEVPHPARSTCKFTCPPNYQLLGSSTITCMSNSEWTNPPPICKITCPSGGAPEGVIVNPKVCTDVGRRPVLGTRCHYQCLHKELKLNGPSTRECLTTGKWSNPEPTCQMPCRAFVPNNKQNIIPSSCTNRDSLADAVCAFSCDDDMIQTGSEYRVCLSNGSWSGIAAKCLTPCQPPKNIPQNSMLNSADCLSLRIPLGFQCSISCLPEYERRGLQSVTCIENGTWSGMLGGCVKRCPKLSRPQHSIIQPSFCLGDDIFEGSECKFSCQDQYIPKGQNLKLCQENGDWSKGDFTCERSCPVLKSRKNRIYEPKECGITNQIMGTECVLSCPTSYTLNGDISKTLTCKENGEWDLEPFQECVQTCTKPTSKQGEFQCMDKEGMHTDLHVIGTTCILICNENYVIEDTESSTCIAEKNFTRWDPQMPYCVFQPDSMIIFNRVGFTAVCFGEENTQVVLIDWPQCSTANSIKWAWKSRYSIRNVISGRCISVAEPTDGTYLTTEICDESNTLQQWNCDEEITNTLKLRNFSLYVNTENGDGVVLRDAVSRRSLVYTFNPNSDVQVGSICTMRRGSKCPKLWLPSYAQALPLHCGSEESNAGTTCGVKCDNGNQEITNVTCDYSGTWSPDGKTVCKPLCSRYPVRSGVQFLESACDNLFVLSGTSCTLTCTRGKVISRTVTTTCTANLTWTPILPYQCNWPCAVISSVENGYLEPSICSQEMCTVSCYAGYKIQGPKYRMCEGNGKWSGSNFTCVPDLQFRIFNFLEFKGSKLCLEVNSGSIVFKKPCKANYKPQLWRWESDALLENVMYERCLIFEESDVTFNFGERSFNASATHSSEIEFNNDVNSHSKVVTAKCDLTNPLQRWQCGDTPHLQYSSLQQISTELFLDAGPVFRTSLNIRKQKYRSTLWKGEYFMGSQSICAFRNTGVCPPLKMIYGGKIQPHICMSKLIIAGTRCQFQCSGDFALSGEDYIVCQVNGEWSNKAPICIGTDQCPVLPGGKNFKIFPQSCTLNLVAEGTVCNIQCSENSASVGGSQITCVEGGVWNGTFPACDVRCPAIIPPKNGRVISGICEEGNIIVDYVCNVTCDPHFILVGSESRSCNQDGMWSGKRAHCVQKCEPIEELENGRTLPENCVYNSSNHGDSCTFECYHGFALRGSYKMTCRNGKWSHIKPTCSADFCARLSSTEKAEIVYSGLRNGAIVVNSIMAVRCLQGYQITGPERRLCLVNGKWESGKEPCIPITCPPLTEPYNGVIYPPECVNENSKIMPGEYCYFSCNEGYILSGTTSIQCPENGVWKYSEVPQCIDTHSKSYFITFQIKLRGKLINESCLETTKSTVYPIVMKCEVGNLFQLWNWYSGKNIQNVANQLCLNMDDQRLSLNTCSTNGTQQTVTCASNDTPSSKYHVLIGKLYLDENLNGKRWQAEVTHIRWVAAIKNIDNPPVASSNFSKETTLCNAMCGGVLMSNSGDFATPAFPNAYPSFVQCKWIIKTTFGMHKLRVGFSRISLRNFGNRRECQDNIVVKGDHVERICSSKEAGFSIDSMNGVVKVVFDASSNDYHQNTGFSAHWTSIPWPEPKSNCGDRGFDQPVHNYTSITPTRAMWQTIIIHTSMRPCNAFLISERFVMTSAHCVRGFFNDSVENEAMIAYGFSKQTDLLEMVKTRSFTKVRAIFSHPQFDANSLKNDIALVMSRTEMQLKDSVQPVCLSRYNMHKLSECFAVQWSTDMFQELASEWRFTKVYQLDVLSDQECSTKLPMSNLNAIDAKLKLGCARLTSYRKHVNDGSNEDGFLIQCRFNGNWYASGVTSRRIEHDLDIYADLRFYHSWIKETTENAFYILQEEAMGS